MKLHQWTDAFADRVVNDKTITIDSMKSGLYIIKIRIDTGETVQCFLKEELQAN
ncbi:MAG TPA: T9SS type A sorting domain-containing protein [Cytophagaceae bacterium]